MATDLGQSKSPPASKYENFVKTQLARAESRIRTLDLTAALLGFAAGTLAYAVVVALLDRLLELPPVVRQTAWVVYLLAGLAYLTLYVIVPLSRRINPYFAARQLERSLPGSKNSVVNWLDLHDENLPPAIRGAVGQRAARDLGQADLDKAVSARRTYWAGGVAALCGAAFLTALFTLGPAMFLARLGRAFAPFGANGASAIATRTRLTIVAPVDGNAVVGDARPVEIRVQVDGHVPDPRAADAVKLLFRYQPTAPYQTRQLDQDDGGRWSTTLAANDVQDGFWYKVTGGDAETKEYRVQLTPRLTDFKAVYQFRPYLARVKETRLERKIEAVRGTQVDVTVHTNRELKEGYLQFDGANGARSVTRGEVAPDDATGFRVRLTLDESSQYRICFTSTTGEEFVEPQPSPLIAVPDRAPVVTLTKPAELKEKPGWVAPMQADGILSLEGNATDDIGVAGVRLSLRVEDGPTLPARDYRSPDKFKLPHGGNPVSVDYEDFVDLAKFKNPADPLFAVRPGMVLEYWLTAEDACDYPKPNVGESKHYRVQIVEPLNNDKVKKDQQDQADKSKQENETKQDRQNQKEDAQRQEKNQKTEQQNNDRDAKGQQQQSGNGSQEKKPDDKDGQQQNADKGNGGSDHPKSSDNPPNGKTGDAANQQSNASDQKNSGNGQDGKNNVANALKQALKDHEKDQEGTGKDDPKQQPAGDGKGGGAKPKSDTADAKPGPENQPGGQQDASAAKDQGPPDAKQPKEGDGKSGGNPQSRPDAKPGENKQGGDPKAQTDAQPGQGKDAKADASAQPGADKSGGKPEEQKSAGGDKPQGDASAFKGDKAESKGGHSPDDAPNAHPAGEAKDKAAPETKAEAKGGGPENHDNDANKAEAKADGSKSPMGDQKPAASAKPEGAKADKQDVAQHKSDGGGEGEPTPEEMKPQDVADLAKDLKSDDPAKREEAIKKLEQAEQKARDEQARKDAGQALDDAGVKSEDVKVAEGKPKPSPDGKPSDGNDKPAEDKTGKGDNSSSAGKEGAKDDVAKGETKGEGRPTDKNDPMNQGKPTKPGEAKGGPGNGAERRHGDLTQTADATPPPAPEKPVAPKASVLQLRKFLDTVDKKVLEDAKRDPAEMKKLQEEARKWLAEHPLDGDNETPAGPQQGGALGSTAGHRSNADGKAATDDPDTGGRPLPPPGYRDPYKEFTKLLSPGGDK